MKPFNVFICYKKSSGGDFAEHLKAGLEELGLHSFIDSKDIRQIVDGKEEWAKIRDRAIEESKTFILIITPGFELSPEVIKELTIARKIGNKEFIYFRHRNLGRKIILDLETEKVDFGKQQQVSFENKEELLRLAYSILLKNSENKELITQPTSSKAIKTQSTSNFNESTKEIVPTCAACSKPLSGNLHSEVLNGKTYNFDSVECAKTYRKLKLLRREI